MVEISIKGKRKFVHIALLRLKKYLSSKPCIVEEVIPEFYYHASNSMSVSIKLNVKNYLVNKHELDSLGLEGSSIQILDSGGYAVLLFIKPIRSTEFIVKKQETVSTKVVFSSRNLINNLHDTNHSDSDTLDLKEGETLEQYEERIYG